MPAKVPKRRRVVGAIAKMAPLVPETYVESPVQTVLGSAHRIVETELAFIERKQKDSQAPMSPADAKKFASLVAAFEKAVMIGKALDDEELKGLTKDQLDQKLIEAVEAERALKTHG